jgi:dTDP-4-amino-4,6-dideoxygalactose transaminase
MIKFLDLEKINHQYASQLKKVVAEIIDSGRYLLGEKLLQFENSLAQYLSVKHVIGVGNGLDALKLILRAYIEKGVLCEKDEVIVPANTFIASILAITGSGLKPILAEPDIDTYNLNLKDINRYSSNKTRAIMPVHLYGRTCWSEELEYFARKRNLIIIEDNAQATGANWGNKKTGTLGVASGFSFYPGKNLGALADAGAAVTNDDDIAIIIKALRNYGSEKKYIHDYNGTNSRMSEIQAAFLSIKLKYLDEQNNIRRKIAEYYSQHIKNKNIILPKHPEDKREHIWHLYVVRTSDRDRLQKYLYKKGVETLIHYPIPPHLQKAYMCWDKLSLPLTEKIHKEVLSLPMDPTLNSDEIDQIVSVINNY